LTPLHICRSDLVPVGRDLLAETLIQKLLSQRGKIGLPPDGARQLPGVIEGWRVHELKILLVLSSRSGGDLVYPLADVASGDAAKMVEGGKELVVPAEARGGYEAAHRECVDEFVV
jgi:hypothetical protein